MGIKETANTFHLSRNTVRKYVRLFISSGKTTEQLLEFSEEHLREMFGCTEFRHREPSHRQLELDELNTAIHISLHDFNERLMAGRNMSRKDMFLQGEKDFLRPLPEKPFVIKERKLMTVGKNCYVSQFKHHYSVPREHVGKRVVILYDATR